MKAHPTSVEELAAHLADNPWLRETRGPDPGVRYCVLRRWTIWFDSSASFLDVSHVVWSETGFRVPGPYGGVKLEYVDVNDPEVIEALDKLVRRGFLADPTPSTAPVSPPPRPTVPPPSRPPGPRDPRQPRPGDPRRPTPGPGSN